MDLVFGLFVAAIILVFWRDSHRLQSARHGWLRAEVAKDQLRHAVQHYLASCVWHDDGTLVYSPPEDPAQDALVKLMEAIEQAREK